MFTSNIARRLVGIAGTLSLSALGMAAVASSASASPSPSVCKASNVSVTFLGKTGTVNEGYNPQHPSFPNTATKYRLLVTNKGAPCTLKLTDPSVSIYTPAYSTSVPGANSNAEQGLLVKGDADWFTLTVQNPANYALLSCVTTDPRGHRHHHHGDGGYNSDIVWTGNGDAGHGHDAVTTCSYVNVNTYQTVHIGVSLPGVAGPPQEVFTGWGSPITFAEVAGSFSTGPLNG